MENYDGAVLMNVSTLKDLLLQSYEAGSTGWKEAAKTTVDGIVYIYLRSLEAKEQDSNNSKKK